MGTVRMAIMLALVLGVVWVIRVGEGEDASLKAMEGVQWVMDKGKRYIWNAALELFNR